LEDMTFRAVRILKESARIACEDTRTTRKLLDHYGIATVAVSYHEHNEAERTKELLDRLQWGESVALVSDAGTPLISDPGFRIVKAAREAGISVVPVPGACAAVTALSASGLGTDAFYFGGFLPSKTSQRKKVLEQLGTMEATLAFYESPHRILETLDEISVLFPSRLIVLGRELTKLHEEFLVGTACELRQQLGGRPSVKGEFVLLMDRFQPGEQLAVDESLPQRMARLTTSGLSRMDAMKAAARELGISKREVYQRLEDES
jgi:16S rRNA (cytidine1402-2'-O)-methyltransferase